AAAHLVARDGEARRLLAEAEALDRVLEHAPLPPLAAEAALAERIVVAAMRSPRIVRLPGTQRAADAAPARTPAKTMRTAVGLRRRWRPLGREAGAVGLLAASLVLGV